MTALNYARELNVPICTCKPAFISMLMRNFHNIHYSNFDVVQGTNCGILAALCIKIAGLYLFAYVFRFAFSLQNIPRINLFNLLNGAGIGNALVKQSYRLKLMLFLCFRAWVLATV